MEYKANRFLLEQEKRRTRKGKATSWQEAMEQRRSVQFVVPTGEYSTPTLTSSVVEKGIAQLEKLDRDQLKIMFFVLATGLGLRAIASLTELMATTIVSRLLHKGVELGFFCLFLVVIMAIYKKANGIKLIW